MFWASAIPEGYEILESPGGAIRASTAATTSSRRDWPNMNACAVAAPIRSSRFCWIA